MKVILVNGSPRKHGCTAAALDVVAEALRESGVEAMHYFIGNEPLADCIACYQCSKTGRCVFDDQVNSFVDLAMEADGFIFGSPVYYGHPSGRLMAFMDRAFYSGGRHFRFKPAAGVLAARRAGQVASQDVINKHFTLNSMPVVSSTYWNIVYGAEAEEVKQDPEGLNTMRNLGYNMAWLIKCIALGKEQGVPIPENKRVYTNFVR